jgi:pre-mRNA-splicing factor CWC26
LEIEQLKQRALKEAEGEWVTIHTSAPTNSSPFQSSHDNTDLSPPRRSHDKTDLSPPRRSHDKTDLSSPRCSHDNTDLSPPRRSHDSTDDISTRSRSSGQKRKFEATDSTRFSEKIQKDVSSEHEPPTKHPKQEVNSTNSQLNSRRRAGLLTTEEVVKEIDEKKKAEEQRFAMRSPAELGKGAKTIYRDRHGRRLDMLTQFLNQEKGIYIEDEDQHMEWGKGYVDPKEKEEQKQQTEEEKGRPYRGRTLDDAQLNEEWREKERWGDPMASFLSKENKERKKKKKVYQGPWPPNRFNIPPAAAWDGVDRSNGYERNYFLNLNEKKAMQEIAYKYLSEDM